jgi:hypothetical protein
MRRVSRQALAGIWTTEEQLVVCCPRCEAKMRLRRPCPSCGAVTRLEKDRSSSVAFTIGDARDHVGQMVEGRRGQGRTEVIQRNGFFIHLQEVMSGRMVDENGQVDPASRPLPALRIAVYPNKEGWRLHEAPKRTGAGVEFLLVYDPHQTARPEGGAPSFDFLNLHWDEEQKRRRDEMRARRARERQRATPARAPAAQRPRLNPSAMEMLRRALLEDNDA